MLLCATDDLPIRGFIGHLEEGSILPHNHKTYLWTHLHFSFEHNGDQVGCPGCVDNSASSVLVPACDSECEYPGGESSPPGRCRHPAQDHLHLQCQVV